MLSHLYFHILQKANLFLKDKFCQQKKTHQSFIFFSKIISQKVIASLLSKL